MRRLLPWALPAALLLEPIRSALAYGQINMPHMALVTFDCLTRAPDGRERSLSASPPR